MSIKLSDKFDYKKLITFTISSIVTMILTSIYSVVDGFFVSNYAGKTAFAAVNLIMPLLQILSTVGFMFGTGGTALVAKMYGEGDINKANRSFSLFVYAAFFIGLLFACFGFIFARPIVKLLRADNELFKNAVLYLRVNLISLPFFILQVMFQSFLVAAEKPKLGLVVTIVAGLTNLILDAILVISLPYEKKLFGAAIATALAQFMGAIIPLIYFFKSKTSILKLGPTNMDKNALLKASSNGMSEVMSSISMSVVGILYNFQLMKFAGESGIASYGVMMYVSMIFSAAFVGYTIGTAPIVSYNYGAKNHTELKNILKRSIIMILIFGISMILFAEISAYKLSEIFVGYDKELLEMTASGFKIFSISFGFMGFNIFLSGFFTALNDGVTSAIISALRTLVFQTSAILILPMILGIEGIWISVVFAEIMAFIVGFYFLIIKQKKYNY